LTPPPDVDREGLSLRRCRPPDSDDTAAAELLADALAGARCLPEPLSAGARPTVDALPSASCRVVWLAPTSLPGADLPPADAVSPDGPVDLLVAAVASVPVGEAGAAALGGFTLTAGSCVFVEDTTAL